MAIDGRPLAHAALAGILHDHDGAASGNGYRHPSGSALDPFSIKTDRSFFGHRGSAERF